MKLSEEKSKCWNSWPTPVRKPANSRKRCAEERALQCPAYAGTNGDRPRERLRLFKEKLEKLPIRLFTETH